MGVVGNNGFALRQQMKRTSRYKHNNLHCACLASEVDENGMVIDYSNIKKAIHNYLDHGNLNELLPFNPTAENIAAWVVRQFPQCYKAIVEESFGNVAQAFDDNFPIDAKYLM